VGAAVTSEEDFQRALDEHPDDFQTRLVFADWLQERGDPRAEGYRALGVLGRIPTWAFNQPTGRVPWYLWISDAHIGSLTGSFRKRAGVMRTATLPADWCRRMYLNLPKKARTAWNHKHGWFGYGKSRRQAEDGAALAFARLPAKRRAELLTAPTDSPLKKVKKSAKPKKPKK
jgi:uncharacterized protein (TIGR02996 family)